MPEDHTVSAGECMHSIAFEHGFFWETLWNHADNATLKEQRKEASILLEGDVVHIPDLTVREESCAAEEKHRFRLKGVPARLRMRFFRPVVPEPEEASGGGQYEPSHYEGPPPPEEVEFEEIADAPFVLVVDGISTEGQTDGEGMVDVPIPPNASSGTIKFHPGMPEEISFELSLGGMDPGDSVTGVRKRLNNLGCGCLPTGDAIDDSLRAALRRFQEAQSLTVSGEIDQATKDKLKQVHGS